MSENKEVLLMLQQISGQINTLDAKVDEIPTVLNGLGIAIISTSKGIVTDKQARKEQIGGEVLAYIW